MIKLKDHTLNGSPKVKAQINGSKDIAEMKVNVYLRKFELFVERNRLMRMI